MTDEVRPQGNKLMKGCLIVAGLFLGAVVLLILIGMATGGGDTGTADGAAKKADQPAATKVTAEELAGAYDDNEVAAQQKYGGKRLEVTGTVTSIELDLGDDPVVMLAGVNPFLSVQAPIDDKNAAAAIKKGTRVTVTCSDVSEVISAPMLHDCKLTP